MRKQNDEDLEPTLVSALQIDGIDLEPTEDELTFFLEHQSTIGIEEITRMAHTHSSITSEELTDIERAYEEVIAMNRKNATDSYSPRTKDTIDRKRKQLLEELTKRHEHAE